MKNIGLISLTFAFLLSCNTTTQEGVFIEAENFTEKGGWVVDQQFMDLMGSSYLMAHGMGVPVADAETKVVFPASGEYEVFVRTYNWTSPWFQGEGPGKFQVLVNGRPVGNTLGNQGSAWMWQRAGTINIQDISVTVTLHDLTGFNGRCDAIWFSRGNTPPPDDVPSLAKFRKKQMNLPKKPNSAGEFDLVIVGGGIAGTCAAVSAARLSLLL